MFSFAIFDRGWLARVAVAVALIVLAALLLTAAGIAALATFIAWLFRASWFWVLIGILGAAAFFCGTLWSAWRAFLELDEPAAEVAKRP